VFSTATAIGAVIGGIHSLGARDKDTYMDKIRQQKGNGKGDYGDTHNIENSQKTPLENLEAKGGFRTLCSLERQCDHHRVLAGLSSNRSAALQAEDDDDEIETSFDQQLLGPSVNDLIPASHKNQFPNHANNIQRKVPNDKVTVKKKAATGSIMDIHSLELNAVRKTSTAGDLWITIDSGASENVIGEGMAPGARTVSSVGSRSGVQYVTANGTAMPNRGEQHIQVLTDKGHCCMLNMQVTDVKKPLMSVARICEAGHEVIFTSSGGVIRHLATGQETKFGRCDNVYRLKVGLLTGGSVPGFPRQGAK
jgi:hypothetical protein